MGQSRLILLLENNKAGWTEVKRCPLYTLDKLGQAIRQMDLALTSLNIDVFISVGGWPQFDDQLYRNLIKPLKKEIVDPIKTALVIADALPSQLKLLKEGYAHANIGQNFRAMGRLAYQYMKKLSAGKSIPKVSYTPSQIYWHKKP